MTPDFILLYVQDPEASGRFYGDRLGRKPLDSRPGFVMFMLDGGMRLGLWGRDTVVPAPTAAGGFEIGWPLAQGADVDQMAIDWAARGMSIIQQPETMGFGRTFTALDPDGHRLRVYQPALRQ